MSILLTRCQNENTNSMTSGQCFLLGPVTGLLQPPVAHRWINLYPMDSAIDFPNTYPLDSDLSGG